MEDISKRRGEVHGTGAIRVYHALMESPVEDVCKFWRIHRKGASNALALQDPWHETGLAVPLRSFRLKRQVAGL